MRIEIDQETFVSMLSYEEKVSLFSILERELQQIHDEGEMALEAEAYRAYSMQEEICPDW